MAKTNKEAIMSLCKEIETKEGEGTVYSLGSKKANMNIKRWSTGIEDLDEILGGGMPEGRVVEIFGPESSGKTTLLYHLCGLHELALDIPVEGTFDAERAKVFGNRPKQLLIYRPKYGEQAMNRAIKFAQAGIPLIGFDSVPSLVPKDDVDQVIQSSHSCNYHTERQNSPCQRRNKHDLSHNNRSQGLAYIFRKIINTDRLVFPVFFYRLQIQEVHLLDRFSKACADSHKDQRQDHSR